jgi:sensor histidine kinase YesM
MRRDTVAYWRRMIVGMLAASGVVVLMFSGTTWRTPASELARSFRTAMLFSACIAPLIAFAMPRLAPKLWCRLAPPFNWVAIVIVIVALAMVGTVAAVGILVALHVIAPARFVPSLLGSLRVSIAVTLTIGLFITAYEMMRARLAQASAAAQLASLESRVQPHFLFNTLNSIAALVHDDPAGAERMTTRLASLMRSALDAGADPLVRLDEELRVVRDYLDIEQVRFRDRLRFAIDRDADAADAMVPRFAIQTLVENAVRHAVTPSRQGATITVRVSSETGHVGVAVEDDGPGFDGSTLPEGHGLALLRARLSLLFADRAALRIDSVTGRTVVRMDVPLSTSRDRRDLRFRREASRLA